MTHDALMIESPAESRCGDSGAAAEDAERFEVVCCLALGDAQAAHHLRPISMCPAVRRMWIVRHRDLPELSSDKTNICVIDSPLRLWRIVRMMLQCWRLARREEVGVLVSFNPFPYGLITLLAGWLAGKPVHCGFIGSDWHLKRRRPWIRWTMPLLRRAWLTTVPGRATRQEAVNQGFSDRRVVVLPHAIDLAGFPVADGSRAEFDCVFLGRLVPVKRVDLILDAWSMIRRKHAQARCLIVGDGPLREALAERACQLELSQHVLFVGHQHDVSAQLRKARVFLMASDSEGLPFALVEGICSGLVPVATDVGSIGELIVHRENGLLVNPGDALALAGAVDSLLCEDQLYQQLRENVVQHRSSLGYPCAAEIWAQQFARLSPTANDKSM